MLITIISFLLILGVLVVVHELGHFVAAKKLGIKVEEFGFGLPPRIWGVKRGETIYSINALPIGGFVKLLGEDQDNTLNQKSKVKSQKLIERAFFARPVWQRALVLVAGVSMNFLLAVLLISYLFTQGVMVPTDRVHVEKIVKGTPAESAGLKEKDIIKDVSSEGKKEVLDSSDKFVKYTRSHLGKEITMTIDREGKKLTFKLTPRKEFPKDQGPLGVVISSYEEKKYSLVKAPILGTWEAVKLSGVLLVGVGQTLWKLVSFQGVAQDVTGPVGIAELTGQAVKFGHIAVLELMGLLSLNLAIVNILPFPALDGGRLFFVLVEGITKKKIRPSWERNLHQIGMIILLALILLVTLNDIIKIFAR
ncbi:MAG: Membrane-associated zinc metalloprotease [Candidatus Gottesmanbacteria bacterium GW2011_GWA2_41_12]|uniref:Membrane-associated zinc metalloprotease n=2 Tax=Candidatus Gottesmaniibacteriota TaxID=1752720 RepID=A0A0G0XKW7_9BACT|nr:MAG: Membrane-associated zinc metalloprotease [Candidatus Gottesmanbacteria bacterium GW2011_GWC2_39_8]KKR88327.1 MAG: Membrane-associated zinc metalloprotease [Candidatus Gottesmanbacteria bacterium GW2011_GWA2_41_12]